jgi:hypothetical protein
MIRTRFRAAQSLASATNGRRSDADGPIALGRDSWRRLKSQNSNPREDGDRIALTAENRVKRKVSEPDLC